MVMKTGCLSSPRGKGLSRFKRKTLRIMSVLVTAISTPPPLLPPKVEKGVEQRLNKDAAKKKCIYIYIYIHSEW